MRGSLIVVGFFALGSLLGAGGGLPEAWIKGDDASWKETEVIFGGWRI